MSSPCSENNGGCEQLCFSFPNKTEPKCQCATGVLDKNGKSEYLVVAAETEIISVSLDPRIKSAPIPPVKGLFGVVAVDFDYDESYIYFSQVLRRSIGRVKMGTNDIEDMAKTGNDSGMMYTSRKSQS